MCFLIDYHILHVKIQFFVTLKPDQDPDPHGPALIRLLIDSDPVPDPHRDKKLDPHAEPDPAFYLNADPQQWMEQ